MNMHFQNEVKSPNPNQRKENIVCNSAQLEEKFKDANYNNYIHSFRLQREIIKNRTINHSAKNSIISDNFFATDSSSKQIQSLFKEEQRHILSNVSSNVKLNVKADKDSLINISKISDTNSFNSILIKGNCEISKNDVIKYPNSHYMSIKNDQNHKNQNARNSINDTFNNNNVVSNANNNIYEINHQLDEEKKDKNRLTSKTTATKHKQILHQTKKHDNSINSQRTLESIRSDSNELKHKEIASNIIHNLRYNKEINVAPIINSSKKTTNSNSSNSMIQNIKNKELSNSLQLLYHTESNTKQINDNSNRNMIEESRVLLQAKHLKQNLEKYISESKKEDFRINEGNYHYLINLMHNISIYLYKNSSSLALYSNELEKLDFIQKTLNLISINSKNYSKEDANTVSKSICNNKKISSNFYNPNNQVSEPKASLINSILENDGKLLEKNNIDNFRRIKNFKDKDEK